MPIAMAKITVNTVSQGNKNLCLKNNLLIPQIREARTEVIMMLDRKARADGGMENELPSSIHACALEA